MSRKKKFNLAEEVKPGKDRVWSVTHQPKNQNYPVKLELREFTVDRTPTTPMSFTRVLGFINTIADEKRLVEDAKTLITRVGRVDQFVGIYE